MTLTTSNPNDQRPAAMDYRAMVYCDRALPLEHEVSDAMDSAGGRHHPAPTVGCSNGSKPADKAPPQAAPKKALGIRPAGDETIHPDLAKVSDELKTVYRYIDDHIDEHVENLQKWVRQPSISNSGEGIPESAEMVKGFFEQLGCQESRVYDVGITGMGRAGQSSGLRKMRRGRATHGCNLLEYDTAGYAARRVVLASFEGRIVEQAPFKKVLIAPRRGELERS